MTDDRQLSFSRRIAARPGTVWRCWTEPELLAQWFAPRPVTTTVTRLDLHPGGGFATRMDIPDHGVTESDPGCFLVVEPERRLVWTNALGPDYRPNVIGAGQIDFAFTADIRLERDGDGTLYSATVTHARPEDAARHESMGFHDGWGTAAAQLEEVAVGL